MARCRRGPRERLVDWFDLVVAAGRDPARRAAVHQRRRVDRRGVRALRGRRGERPGGGRDGAARDHAPGVAILAGRTPFGRRDRDRRHPRRAVHAATLAMFVLGASLLAFVARPRRRGRRLRAEASVVRQDLAFFVVMYGMALLAGVLDSRALRWALGPSCWSRTASTWCATSRLQASPSCRARQPARSPPLSARLVGSVCGRRRAAPGGRRGGPRSRRRRWRWAHRGRGQGVRGRHRRAGQDLDVPTLCSRCWWRPSPPSCPSSSTA